MLISVLLQVSEPAIVGRSPVEQEVEVVMIPAAVAIPAVKTRMLNDDDSARIQHEPYAFLPILYSLFGTVPVLTRFLPVFPRSDWCIVLILMLYLLLALLLFSASVFGQRKSGNPLDHLPANITVLTHFGERADISPDNRRIAFMDKSFGDAFVIDLQTHAIRCLTCNVPGAAFLRVMYLHSGDYLLIGPARFVNIHRSRTVDNELWFLSKKPGSVPEPLHQKLSEGAAISKRSMKIAYAVTPAQDPALPPGHSQLFVADVEVSGGSAHLANKHMVYESRSKACTIEAQDFFDRDRKMTFTCYEPHDLASVMTIDLNSGKVENMSKAPGKYDECEGIYPGGLYTNVEADRQVDKLGGTHGSGNIDIWKLRLDGTGKDFKRLTYFNDYEGFKASNPVVSTDGRFMAFQVAHPADEAGVGYGILLYHFR